LRIPSKRKAISPVLATVILIAITLIAAVAIATFVFGIFGTSASPATLSIPSSSVICSAAGGTLDGVTGVPVNDCVMKVVNTGTAGGSINGAGPGSGAIVFTLTGSGPIGGGAYAAGAPVSVPSNGGIYVVVHLSAYTTGQAITGFVTQGNGPQLTFTAVLGS